jgi:hypothetical protein
MRKRPRITRFDGAVLADTLFLIGQAWVRRDSGDTDGAAEDLAAAMKLVPADTVEAIHNFIEIGTPPEPAAGPGGMDAWLETCRMAGAGELEVIRILFPSAAELAEEERAAFFGRLAEIRADAERRIASGETGPWRPDVPERPPPWEVADSSLKGLDRPGSLSESLRRMGLM